MKKFLILILLLVNVVISAQTVTLFTKSEERHNIINKSIEYNIVKYSSFTFSNNLITVISGDKNAVFTIHNTEDNKINQQLVYHCSDLNMNRVTFFVREYLIAVDIGERDIVYIFKIYDRL